MGEADDEFFIVKACAALFCVCVFLLFVFGANVAGRYLVLDALEIMPFYMMGSVVFPQAYAQALLAMVLAYVPILLAFKKCSSKQVVWVAFFGMAWLMFCVGLDVFWDGLLLLSLWLIYVFGLFFLAVGGIAHYFYWKAVE